MSEPLKCPNCGHQVGTMFTFPEPIKYLGGCNCAFKPPTPPTCRDPMRHLDDCPARNTGYPVGALLANATAAAATPLFLSPPFQVQTG